MKLSCIFAYTFIETNMKKFKVLKSGIDFVRTSNIEPTIGETFLIKTSVASGWARVGKVTKITKTQIELEVIDLIPTEDSNKFGIKNHFKNRTEGFFADWCWRKKATIGQKRKFFKSSSIEVGDTNQWNPTILAQLV